MTTLSSHRRVRVSPAHELRNDVLIKPSNRMVIRIMLMPPLYAVASLISLIAPGKAVLIDAGRDVYEAFVIYCFFHLLLSYLGGEREMLIMLQGREPKTPLFPMNLWRRELDGSDPYEWLWMKRGILQYVQIKPILAVATLLLKLTGTYQDGNFTPTSGYLYISIIYNVSICLALYSLASFWLVVSSDLEGQGGGAASFRPVPKFVCVKGILVLTFWQGLVVSGLVESGTITHLGHLTNEATSGGGESVVAVAVTDLLVCLQMPIFAIAHMWAFSHRDFVNLPSPSKTSQPENGHMDTTPYIYVARLTFLAAFRDSSSFKDVWEDTKATLKGEGMDYRAFEPSEGAIHVGEGRERRIRAGLRYTRGSSQRLKKYWLPDPADEEGAPLMREDEAEQNISSLPLPPAPPMHAGNDPHAYSLSFPSPSSLQEDEDLYLHARNYLFGDYNYPVVDVSGEEARRTVWEEEERVLRDERGAWGRRAALHSPPASRKATPNSHGKSNGGYGAVSHSRPNERVIDFGAEDLPAEGGGVRMAWTRLRKGVDLRYSAPPPRRASPIHRPPPSSSQHSSPRVSISHGSPGASTSHRSPKMTSPEPILPNDAVDLVVADDARRLRRVYSPHGEDHDASPFSPMAVSSPHEEDVHDLEGEVGEVVGEVPEHQHHTAEAVKVSPPVYVAEEGNPWA
ncbi:organic solute transporter Ostalpha-domain-containing protein [Mucidula mucida]|nr:organic solute transporter Ostalpha-domain-containing protein [Mucidula mucida]